MAHSPSARLTVTFTAQAAWDSSHRCAVVGGHGCTIGHLGGGQAGAQGGYQGGLGGQGLEEGVLGACRGKGWAGGKEVGATSPWAFNHRSPAWLTPHSTPAPLTCVHSQLVGGAHGGHQLGAAQLASVGGHAVGDGLGTGAACKGRGGSREV